MSLQDDVNVQVANILAGISIAEAQALPGSVVASVDMQAVRDALAALQGQINTLENRLHALDGGGASPQPPPPVADAEVEVDVSSFALTGGAHLGAFTSAIDLLITQSNFDGAGETE